ncbi:MAG: DUF1488 family protein [Burkholderiaceae bacterium]
MRHFFEPIPSPTYKTVSFRLMIDGQSYTAMISREALSDHFGAGDDPNHWVDTYITNAAEIDAVATKKIRKGSRAPVMVITDDFC